MDAYVFNAALLCDECAERQCRECLFHNVYDEGDSETFPQGPYAYGGGESDTPQHCDDCGVHLENPLTDYGYAYVREAIDEDQAAGRYDSIACTVWAKCYGIAEEHDGSLDA